MNVKNTVRSSRQPTSRVFNLSKVKVNPGYVPPGETEDVLKPKTSEVPSATVLRQLLGKRCSLVILHIICHYIFSRAVY